MFTDQERQEIVAVKERLLKMVDGCFVAHPIPTAIYDITKNGILTGGAIASAFHIQTPNDYDIYFKNADHIESVRKIFLDPSMHKWISTVKHNYIQPVVAGHYYTNNAITLVNGIQFIILGTTDLRNIFDFVHCQPWLDLKTKTLHISEAQYRAIKGMQLIRNPAGPTPAGHRIKKYVERGWRMDNDPGLQTLLNAYQLELNLDKAANAANAMFDQSMQKLFEQSAAQVLEDQFEKLDLEDLKARYEDDYGLVAGPSFTATDIDTK